MKVTLAAIAKANKAEVDAAGKTPVFGLLKRRRKFYTKIIPDTSATTLIPVIERKIIPGNIVCSNCWRGY